MSLFDATVHGLRARVRSLRTDMELWIDRASAGGDLRQHHTQLTRLHDFIGGTLTAVVAGRPINPDADPPFSGTVNDVPGLRRSVGSVHLLWDFYRDKLAQRDVHAFADHLGAADDLAWACYQPFLTAATESPDRRFDTAQVKEPPLVFYSTDRTPFAQARTKTLHPPGLDAKDVGEFLAALQRLPVPVIGLPWEVANRMPETALVGHEAGHVIAEDLGLAAEARKAVQEASLNGDRDGVRKKVWLAWCDEVFADVIGVLATGTAFVEGLTAELAGEPSEIRQATINPEKPGKYPTPMLRVALCERVLAGIGVAPSTAWSAEYGEIVGQSRDYRDDVAVVASALLGRTWEAVDGKRLRELLPWDAVREEQARTVARTTLNREPAPVPFDVRVWVAAAMHAYLDKPVTYAKRDLDRALATHIVTQRAEGVRSSRSMREPLIVRRRGPQAPATHDEQLREADRQAGAELARRLGIG